MFDNKKYIECPREEATHVYFAGNAHLIAKGKQDVPWCDICGNDIYFYAPGIGSGGFYAHLDQECAPEGAQGPVFLKEKELQVEFVWARDDPGVLLCQVEKYVRVIINFRVQVIRKLGETNDPNAIKFDDDWTIRQIKEAAAEYARKIARGEL